MSESCWTPRRYPDYIFPDWLQKPPVSIIRFPAYLADLFGETPSALEQQRLDYFQAITLLWTEDRFETRGAGSEEERDS
jgi:hypothetical protein